MQVVVGHSVAEFLIHFSHSAAKAGLSNLIGWQNSSEKTGFGLFYSKSNQEHSLVVLQEFSTVIC
jgi:hypothetical protein